MKNKSMIRLIPVIAVIVGLMMLLAGCGQKAVLGTTVKDYDGYKQLKETSINMTNDDELQLFVPGDSVSSSGSYVTGSGNGVTMTVSKQTYTDMTPKKVLLKYGSLNTPDLESAAVKIGKTKKSEDNEKTFYRTGFKATKLYTGKYDGVCTTDFVTRLESGEYVRGSIKVSSTNANDDTEETVKELSSFLQIDVYWDKDKASKAAKKYTANPPTTHRVLVGSFTMEVPVTWKRNYSQTTSSSSYQLYNYGPNGTLSATENILASYKYVGSINTNNSASSYKTYLTNYLSKSYPNMSAQVSDATSPVDGGSAYKVVISSNGKKLSGYFLFADSRYIQILTLSAGDPTSSMQSTIDSAFDSIQAYYSK